MLVQMIKFLAMWFIGATALGLLFGRMIKFPGETPRLILPAAKPEQDPVEEKAG